VSTGFDQFGNKLTFISGHTAEVADKLFAAEREAASKRPALAYAPQKTRKKRGYVTGTGFFVSDRGHVLANYRLVDGATEITVVDSKGAEFPARVVKKDQTYDVVLLKTDATAPKLTVRDDDGLARGTKVYTIGYPLIAVVRQKQHLTFGTVATSKDVIADERFMQLDLPVRAGNAGGPLLDQTGAVVGMVSTPLDPASAAEGRGEVRHGGRPSGVAGKASRHNGRRGAIHRSGYREVGAQVDQTPTSDGTPKKSW
jgi:S1-C subfamily serine protease